MGVKLTFISHLLLLYQCVDFYIWLLQSLQYGHDVRASNFPDLKSVQNCFLWAKSYKLRRYRKQGVVNRISLDAKRVPVRKNPLWVWGDPGGYDLHKLVSWLLELIEGGRVLWFFWHFRALQAKLRTGLEVCLNQGGNLLRRSLALQGGKWVVTYILNRGIVFWCQISSQFACLQVLFWDCTTHACFCLVKDTGSLHRSEVLAAKSLTIER